MDHPRPLLLVKPESAALPPGRRAFARPGKPGGPCAAINRPHHRVAAALLSLLAMGSALSTPAGAQDGQSPQHPDSIRGTVVNALTGEPIGRALVYTPDNRL